MIKERKKRFLYCSGNEIISKLKYTHTYFTLINTISPKAQNKLFETCLNTSSTDEWKFTSYKKSLWRLSEPDKLNSAFEV